MKRANIKKLDNYFKNYKNSTLGFETLLNKAQNETEKEIIVETLIDTRNSLYLWESDYTSHPYEGVFVSNNQEYLWFNRDIYSLGNTQIVVAKDRWLEAQSIFELVQSVIAIGVNDMVIYKNPIAKHLDIDFESN